MMIMSCNKMKDCKTNRELFSHIAKCYECASKRNVGGIQ